MLDQFSDETAGGLARRGVVEGSVVAMLLPSGIEYLVAYAALAKLGAVCAGINPRFEAGERRSVVAAAEADLVISTSELSDGLASDTPVALIEPASDGEAVVNELRISDYVPTVLTPNPDRPVAICFTSGSTGEPKGALFTNRQLEAVRQLDTGGAWGAAGHTIAPTEFAHVGFMTKWPWLIAGGGTTHLQHKWRAARVLELIHQHRMTAVSGVAAQIALLLRQPEFDSYDFSAVTTIVAGAAASPPALVTEARERFGANYLIRYSSTESGGVGLSTTPGAADEEALYSIGRPRAGVQAEIRDSDLQPVATGDVGELWLRSPAVMAEYWRNPRATEEALRDGWLRTGDLARVDESGLYRLSGRVSEMFIRGGYNVYPLEVEAVLGLHPQVRDVVVVPRADPVMGEVGVAVVIPNDPDRPISLADLRIHGGTTLAAYKLPEALEVATSFPMNASQKVDRRALQRLLAEQPRNY